MNAWLEHLKAFYAQNKSKMSYKEAMIEAKKTYKPKANPEAEVKSKSKSKSKAKNKITKQN